MKQSSFSWIAVASACLASLCCIVPVILGLAGIGGAVGLTAWEAYRPHFIALTVLLLGTAFYLAYRPIQACADGSCQPSSRNGRARLWVTALVCVMVIAYPYLTLSEKEETSAVASTVITIPVQGMTCAGCEKNVVHALDDLPGIRTVHADFKNAQVTLSVDSTQIESQNIVKAINSRTSYRAKLADDK